MTEIIGNVRTFVSGHIGERDISDDDELFASGLANSLFAVQIVMWVEQTFDVPITSDDMDIANFWSIAAISSFIAAKQAAIAK
jgi:methoxymalonate biosynthesis acyl carrier protein